MFGENAFPLWFRVFEANIPQQPYMIIMYLHPFSPQEAVKRQSLMIFYLLNLSSSFSAFFVKFTSVFNSIAYFRLKYAFS